ncbi:MAG: hypothetical protein J5643_08510 [Lachnospiraceae bacterium]|nr:hypothetical protein [Lachnospiraceae bacterium]
MWLSLAALMCMVWIAIVSVIFVLAGALDRTGGSSGSKTIDGITLALWMLYVFIGALAVFTSYRLIMAIREFVFYIGSVIAYAAAIAAFFIAGREMNVVVYVLIYIGYMIMTVGTMYACRKAFPEKPLLKSGFVALGMLHLCAAYYLLPIPNDWMAGSYDFEILSTLALIFQAAFYTIAASVFSEFLPKKRYRRMRNRGAQPLQAEAQAAEMPAQMDEQAAEELVQAAVTEAQAAESPDGNE